MFVDPGVFFSAVGHRKTRLPSHLTILSSPCHLVDPSDDSHVAWIPVMKKRQTRWWFQGFNTFEKYARQIGSFPQFSG